MNKPDRLIIISLYIAFICRLLNYNLHIIGVDGRELFIVLEIFEFDLVRPKEFEDLPQIFVLLNELFLFIFISGDSLYCFK